MVLPRFCEEEWERQREGYEIGALQNGKSNVRLRLGSPKHVMLVVEKLEEVEYMETGGRDV